MISCAALSGNFSASVSPFYGSVSRGAARLHLRFVHEPVFAPGVREREDALLSAFVDVAASVKFRNVKDLFAEYKAQAKGWIAASWDLSEKSKRARFYRLTPLGRKQLAAERSKWDTFSRAMALILNPVDQEAQ